MNRQQRALLLLGLLLIGAALVGRAQQIDSANGGHIAASLY
jgi:hypothetical protein